jgi:hypothetical protein
MPDNRRGNWLTKNRTKVLIFTKAIKQKSLLHLFLTTKKRQKTSTNIILQTPLGKTITFGDETTLNPDFTPNICKTGLNCIIFDFKTEIKRHPVIPLGLKTLP